MSHPSPNSRSWTDEQVAAALQQAKSKLESMRNRISEPLAVVGIGCRFPQAENPDAFWRLACLARLPGRPGPAIGGPGRANW